MLDIDRAALRKILIAAPVCAALLIGTAYLGLDHLRPHVSAAPAPAEPVATTTVASAEPRTAHAAPQEPIPAPPKTTPAPVATQQQRSTAPEAPASEPTAEDVTKLGPGELNLPGSGPFTPAPYVPPPPDWKPPPGWSFVPPQVLTNDGGIVDQGATRIPR